MRTARLVAAVGIPVALVGFSRTPLVTQAWAATVSVVNGIPFKTASGAVLHAHGGGMIKAGSYYYWFGENRDGANLVSAYRSTDLKTWELRAHVLRKDMGGELATANIERPKVLYNALTGDYVLWMHKENGVDYGEGRVAVAASSSIEGPYIYYGSFRPLGFDSRDLTAFDDNGTAYLVSATRVNADLNVYRLSPDFRGVEALVHTLWPGQYREAPALFKRGSTYFLLTSGATGWNPNQARYATAASIEGTWSALTNVADGTTYGSQPTYVVPVQGSSTTSYLYMGDRWAGAWSGPVNESRYVWLPVAFPSSTSLSLTWYPRLDIDAATGVLTGVPFSVDAAASYELVSRRSNKLLNVKGASTATGADAEQRTDTNQPSQRFRLVSAGSGYYKIQNVNSGLVLGVTGGSPSDGAVIEQWTDGGWTSQHWQLVSAGGGFYKLRNRATSKVIDVSGGSLSDGANVVQWTDNGGSNQQWQVVVAN